MWRAGFRMLVTVLHVLHGAALVTFRFPHLSVPERRQRVQWWSATLLRRMGITLCVDGHFKPQAQLIVANHVSWLDILAINAAAPARFVSRAEVQHWPVLGAMVSAADTLYIRRERPRDALRVVHQMAEALQAGDAVAVFPESTSGDGHELLPFHANLFQAAVSTHTPIQAVALRYSDAQHAISPAATYRDTSLLQSAWWIARTHGLHVHVQILPIQTSASSTRRQLAQQAQTAISLCLTAQIRGTPP